MKTSTKRQLPPYCLGSLMVLFLIYFFTAGSYLSHDPFNWVHNRIIGYVLSVSLFVGGMLLLQVIFDRVYPKTAAKRISRRKTEAPVLLRVFAFTFDILLAFIPSIVVVSYLFGQKTESGFTVSGWPVGSPLVIVFLYFFIMDNYFGGTIAKRVFGVKRHPAPGE